MGVLESVFLFRNVVIIIYITQYLYISDKFLKETHGVGVYIYTLRKNAFMVPRCTTTYILF